MAEKVKRQADRGVVIDPSLADPYDPKNIKRTKAQFIEAQRIRKEKQAKVEEFARGLDSKPAVEAPKEEAPKVAKKGRPKKID